MLTKSLAAAIGTTLALLTAAPAFAADEVLWTNYEGAHPISYANIPGGGGGNLSLSGLTVGLPLGLALDPAAGRAYIADAGQKTIVWANLDGSGGGQVNTAPVTIKSPVGVAVDPAAGRVYWSDSNTNTIAYANLDGSGAATLNTVGASVNHPDRLAIDPAAGRIYWTNFNTPSIKVSYANLDGSGGGNITTVPTSGNGTGIARDPATGRILWGTLGGEIFSIAPGGGGVAPLNTMGASTADFMRSIAIDPQTSRVFWANEQPTPRISWASLGGGGGADLDTGGAELNFPNSVVVLRRPEAATPPSIDGGRRAGGTLTCSQGGWAADEPAALFYRAPQSFSYAWLLPGMRVVSAYGQTLKPQTAGSYSCQVTATNFAGSATQTSLPVNVLPALAKANRVALVKRGKALVKLACPAPIEPCSGRIRLEPAGPARKKRATSSAGFRLGASFGQKSFSVAPGKSKVIRVELKGAARSLLRRSTGHRARAKLTGDGVEPRTVLLKLAKRGKPKRR
jgi:hypothetical protein